MPHFSHCFRGISHHTFRQIRRVYQVVVCRGLAVVIRCLFLFFILSPQKYSARGSLRYLVGGRDCTDSHSEHSRFQEQNRSPFCTGCGAYHRWCGGYQPIFKDKWALIIPYFLSLLLVIKINTTHITSPASAGLATDQPLVPLLTTLHNSFKSAANTTV